MTHLHPGDEWLHDEHGQHVGCPTANGRDLERHERESRAHYAEHRARGDKPVDFYRDATTTGVTVEINGDYGNPDGSINIMDGFGEVVMWDSAEWIEDPSLMFAIVAYINEALTVGTADIRKRIAP